MTTVRVRFTPNGTPTPGQISFVLRHDEGNRPIASGRDILNGPGEWVPVPVEGADVEVRPNAPGTHYVVKVRAGNDPQQTETFTIPPNGPINFGDLVRYDPKAGMAYEPDPNWYAHLNAIENGIAGTQADLHTARDLAATSASGAAASASTAVSARNAAQTARDQAQTARDETVALGITIDTSAGTVVRLGGLLLSGDTGQRIVNEQLYEGWTAEHVIMLSRVNSTVTLLMYGLTRGEGAGLRFMNLPAGFRPARRNVTMLATGTSAIGARRFEADLGMSGSSNRVGDAYNGVQVQWYTNDAWPNSLPGTPT